MTVQKDTSGITNTTGVFMKLEINRALSTVSLFLFLSWATTATAQDSILQSLIKRISPTSDALASESSLQKPQLANRGKKLFKNVRIYNNFNDFLKLSPKIDEEMAEKLAGFVDFKVNGFSIAKPKTSDEMVFTWVPVQLNQPMKIEMALNRWFATSLVALAKSKKLQMPQWTNSRFMNLLDLLALHISYERSLETDPGDMYFIADLICEQKKLTEVINEPKSDTVINLVKDYGRPRLLEFDISISLPRVEPENA